MNVHYLTVKANGENLVVAFIYSRFSNHLTNNVYLLSHFDFGKTSDLLNSVSSVTTNGSSAQRYRSCIF